MVIIISPAYDRHIIVFDNEYFQPEQKAAVSKGPLIKIEVESVWNIKMLKFMGKKMST